MGRMALQGIARLVAAACAAALVVATAACAPAVDVRALILQARADVAAGRYEAAASGFEKATASGPKAASDPDVWVDYAEAVALARGGKLAGQPSMLVSRALSINASHGRALDLAGSAAWEAGDFRSAATYWQRLLAQLDPGSTRHAELQAAIERAQKKARLSLPREG